MKIICFGDSNTFGYDARALMDDRYPPECRWVDILKKRSGWNVINQGLNGREIPPCSVHVAADTDLLIIMLGTNDLLQGNDSSTVAKKMERFLCSLQFPAEKILLVSPVPMKLGAWVPDSSVVKYSEELSRHYQSIAGKFGTRFVDAGQWAVALTYDGIHYTEDGQIAFAEGLYTYIMK